MTITEEIQEIRELLEDCPDDLTKYQTIIEMGDELDPYPNDYKLDELKVPGCQSDLWLHAEHQEEKLHMVATSDAVIVRGLVAIIFQILNDRSCHEIRDFDPLLLDQLNIQGYQVEEVISRMLTSGELYEARTNEYRFTR